MSRVLKPMRDDPVCFLNYVAALNPVGVEGVAELCDDVRCEIIISNAAIGIHYIQFRCMTSHRTYSTLLASSRRLDLEEIHFTVGHAR